MAVRSRNAISPVTIILAIIIVVMLAVFGFQKMQDNRTPGQKIGAAIDDVSDGLVRAGQEIQPRTTAQKMGDAVKNAGDDVHDALSR